MAGSDQESVPPRIAIPDASAAVSPAGSGADPQAGPDQGASSKPAADSAGAPWAGRRFDRNAFAGDDGSADAELLRALSRFQAAAGPAGGVSAGASSTGATQTGGVSPVVVVDALRSSRLLIPLVATLGESGVADSGLTVDKSAELSIVTVAGPDGRDVLPVFSSVAAMARWNPTARPVPADAVRVGLAAASENTELIVLDPGSATEFALRRPAVWALAQQEPWVPCFDDPGVAAEFARIAASETAVLAFVLENGDPTAVLAFPELRVTVTLAAGLDDAALTLLLARLAEEFSASQVIATRVDSLQLRLRAAPGIEHTAPGA